MSYYQAKVQSFHQNHEEIANPFEEMHHVIQRQTLNREREVKKRVGAFREIANQNNPQSRSQLSIKIEFKNQNPFQRMHQS